MLSTPVPSPSPPEFEPSLRNRLGRRVATGFVLAVVVYSALLFHADSGALFANLTRVPVGVLAGAMVLACGNFVIRYWRWEYYLRKLAIAPRSLDSPLIFLSGFAMTITPGRVGELLKAWMLRASSNTPVARSVSIVLAERITDVAALVLLGGVGLVGQPGGPLWLGSSLVAVSLLAAATSSHALGAWLITRLTGFARLRSLRPSLLEAHRALTDLMTPITFGAGALFGIAAWALQALALLLIANSFSSVGLGVADAMVVYCAPLLAGALAMIPGGLGLTEASLEGALIHFGGPGVTTAVAAAITILIRLVTFWFAVALGFLALLTWRLRRGRFSTF
jgi:glycosyltransferase 2 family protein